MHALINVYDIVDSISIVVTHDLVTFTIKGDACVISVKENTFDGRNANEENPCING